MQKNVFELVSFLHFNINEKKKASKRGKKEYDEKRIVKILIFKSYAIPKRIGLRGVTTILTICRWRRANKATKR